MLLDKITTELHTPWDKLNNIYLIPFLINKIKKYGTSKYMELSSSKIW
jgi:hypothetical protein